MNRIRQLREAKGMTQGQLAELCNTSQPQIQRIELGERKLTEAWMRVIAKALGVMPADLLDMAAYAEFEDDVVPAEPDSAADIRDQLLSLGVAVYTVVRGSVELAGVAVGSRQVVDSRPSSLQHIAPGSIVVAIAEHDGLKSTILRQFLPPSLLVTNRKGSNIALSTDDPALAIRIIGVLTRG